MATLRLHTLFRFATPMLASALLALAACGDSGPENALADYAERLARPLDREGSAAEPAALPRPPRVGKLQLALEDDSLGTLDFLSLTGCEVQVTIGKRNSSLGRMAAPSQRLLLDLEYLRLAPACIRHLRGSDRDELANTLEAAHALKQRQLPARIFNATLGSEEYRELWRVPNRLGDYPAQTGSAVTTALEAINDSTRRWLAGDFRANGKAFELQLSEVARGDGGALLKALGLQARWLGAANALLRQDEGPLCAGPIRHRAADILPNVVGRHFAEGIQAWSADLARREQALLPPLRELEKTLGTVLPEDYRAWRESRDRHLTQWSSAPRRHVEVIQTLLEPCGVLPRA